MSTHVTKTETPPRNCPICGVAKEDGRPMGLCPKCLLDGVVAPTEAETHGIEEHPGVPNEARLSATFPELEFHGLIGAGGMGAVFKVRQPHLDRWVALKVLPEALAASMAFVERFHREAKTLAKLNH